MWPAAKAGAIVTDCDGLRDRIVDMGADSAKIATIRKGIDSLIFYPIDRVHAQGRMGIFDRTLLSAGPDCKKRAPSHYRSDLEASRFQPCGRWVGERGAKLKLLAQDLGVSNRVRVEG